MKFLPRQEGVFSNQKRKPCVACHELIVSGARLCPYCHTVQHAEPWKLIANGLKWIAGATAVISLMIGVTQINRFYQDWREKREAIAELVDASRIQAEPGGYFRAWDLLQEASHLKPGSRLVRRQMVELAMIWLRTLKTERSGTYDIINRLLPTLARGAASADKQIAADVFAHIGWASLLLSTPEPGGRERPVPLDVDRHFAKALKLDQDNAYAHAMLGYWLLDPYNKVKYEVPKSAKAIEHFNLAVQAGRDRTFVRKLQIEALTRRGELEANLEAFRLVNRMRQSGEVMPSNLIYRFLELFEQFRFRYDQEYAGILAHAVSTALDVRDLLETYKWLWRDKKEKEIPGEVAFEQYQYTLACLYGVAGDNGEALRILEALLPQLRDGSSYRRYIEQDIDTLKAQQSRLDEPPNL